MLKLRTHPAIANTMAYSKRLKIRRKNARDLGPSAAMIEREEEVPLIFSNPLRCILVPLSIFSNQSTEMYIYKGTQSV